MVASLSNLCDGDLVGLVKEGPDLHSEFGVMIPRGICQLSADSGTTRILKNTYIYISNFNDNTLVIPRGSIVATVETLDEREDLIIEEDWIEPPTEVETPPTEEEIRTSIVNPSLTKDQIDSLVEFLMKNSRFS